MSIIPYTGTLEIDGNLVEWETTFDQSVKFKCTNCGYCCDSTNVILGFEDIHNIPEELQELRDDGFTYIKGTDHAACPFLTKNTLCSIYEKRPYVCREYPFKVTFVSKNKAFIDLIHSCESIVKEDYLPENEIDFSYLVRKSYYKQLLSEKPELSKELLAEAEIIHILGQPYNWEEIKARLFALLMKTGFSKPYKTMDLFTNKFYFIAAKGSSVTAAHKEIPLAQLQDKMLTGEAKQLMHRYIAMLFTRKLTQVDFAAALHILNEQNSMSSKELQRRAINRIYLTMLFFLNIIAEKNSHNTITSQDVKEAIFLLDATFLAPMEGIIAPLLNV
ncbi:YkgJ family cysteine cluster protein [Candidatus Woesearchaeota archaeon]|nr:YkgJ family cysteine cluster protein [Candidatus Woesearchaeota archaeon]